MKEHYDAIIVGTGAAGLYCALNLPEKMKILLITKQEADQSDSFLAQGGICMLRGEDDYENYFEDTMRAGHYENDKRAVDLMIRSSNEIILISLELRKIFLYLPVVRLSPTTGFLFRGIRYATAALHSYIGFRFPFPGRKRGRRSIVACLRK